MPRKLNTKDFINKATEIHGGFYDYSLAEYSGVRGSVKIICPHHGEFEQMARSHLQGKGCFACNGTDKRSQEEFIKEISVIYKNCTFNKVEYKGRKKPVIITCDIHGDFEKRADEALRSKGCPNCQSNSPMDTKSFVEAASKVHFGKYDYAKTLYRRRLSKLTITCPLHGDFKQTPNGHLSGRGCPRCRKSKGEEKIERFLENYNINYNYEHVLCKSRETGGSLRADFFLPEMNTVIEFDGVQHFKPIKAWGGEVNLKKVQKRDRIKDNFCRLNKIKVIRIKYTDINKVEDILKTQLLEELSHAA